MESHTVSHSRTRLKADSTLNAVVDGSSREGGYSVEKIDA